MPAKKNFTKADGAIDRLFSQSRDEKTHDAYVANVSNVSNVSHVDNVTGVTNYDNISNNTNNTKHTYNTNNYNITKPTNKSKHYDTRGKRGVRFGLLLDERLREDLTHLSKATGSKSVNDLIITVLLEFVEKEENMTKLEMYRGMLGNV